MVNRILFYLLVSFSIPAIAEEAFQFRTEFSKNEVYAGEEIRCDFVLYTNLSTVEVEVAKFPEFRGFWKENLVLRQGRILVPYSRFAQQPWHKIVIGSYRISAMVDERQPTIKPMKLVLKSPYSENTDQTLYSETPTPLRVKPLPEFSSAGEDVFEGAVGQFTLSLDSPEIPFEQNEPATLRYSVRGQGNFQEIAGARVRLPDGVKVLSKRTYGLGSPPYQIQNYEWTLSVDHGTDLEIPPLRFTYFDPSDGQYHRVQTENAQLRYQAPLSPPPSPVETVLALQPIAQWKSATLLADSLWFWLSQALVGLSVIGGLLYDTTQQRRRAYVKSAAYRLAQLRAQAERAYTGGDYVEFLRIGSELVEKHLRERVQLSDLTEKARTTTREQLLKRAATATSIESIERARRFFAAHEALSFSPAGAFAQSPAELYEDFTKILAA